MEMPSRSDVRVQGTDALAAAVLEYPSARSFVVQLRTDADPANGVVCGRVEHVASSRAASFDSLADLARFFSEAIRGGARILTDS
jgi:hypothetical protein